jgi:hypothetical protein
MKKCSKGADGKYLIKGKKYELNEGSRAQVHHGTAYKTRGGLTKEKLLMNKHGRIVSRKKHATAKKEKRLEKHGFFAKKGVFGMVRKNGASPKRSRKRSRRK